MDQLLAHFESDAAGLSHDAAAARLQTHGFNELPSEPPVPLWRRVVSQFTDLVVWLLIVAAAISGMLGEWIDTAAILAIVTLNGLLGFFQEERAQRALVALANMSAPTARVRRGGKVHVVPAREIVPGDILELEAGDRVPADARLLSSLSLATQESALTGESVPVDKDARVVLPHATPLADRRNMVHLGTVVTAGKGAALVAATGLRSELGHIAGLLSRQEPEPTPLERRLAELGKGLIVVCLALVAVIFCLQMWRGGELVEVFLISVSLAVAAVPEGLPAVVTISLALGLQRMVKRNALVRKLPSVETLGSVTVICTDKTGTLTRNEMTVREIVVGHDHFQVTGSGYAPRGEFLRGATDRGVDATRERERVDASHAPGLVRVLEVAARCNNASVTTTNGRGDQWQVIGDPTEGALRVAAMKAGIVGAETPAHFLAEIPFDSDRRMMSVVCDDRELGRTLYCKGAPEVLLPLCTQEYVDGADRVLDEARRSTWANVAAAMAERALRVLALAYRGDPQSDNDGNYREEDLVFAGLVGMIDPPREEARDAVLRCQQAGIRPVMITGDHPATARAIAAELALARPPITELTGTELDHMSDDELTARVSTVTVYARVSAEHKLRIVKALKRQKQIVAMTGDGVNDAPAIKAADIGIAMGISGTDVTKEASDMVLVDDNFASIVNAVEEGRGIFDNIQKFVHYLLACNASEVMLMFAAGLLGWPSPLLAVQILWINLVTDGLPALALAMEPPERDIMQRPPRPAGERVITLRQGLLMLLHGLLLTIASLTGFALAFDNDASNLPAARTTAFCIVGLGQLCYSFACRSQSRTLPELGFTSNPYLFAAIGASVLLQLAVILLPWSQRVFDTCGVGELRWLYIVILSLAPVTTIELAKLVRSARRQRIKPRHNP